MFFLFEQRYTPLEGLGGCPYPFEEYRSKDVLLAVKNKRIKVLEDEIRSLKDQLMRLVGIL
ncbi:MAG TPA: hypothetical protein VFC58_05040 [Desulfosporosinus sp.]|nr:hypothetical protein [Desulfosporosinus sp.]